MVSKNTIYQVDAFTAEPFKGNSAGVMFADKNTKAKRMQAIAMEMKLSETAFIIPGKECFNIRYFTPAAEVPLCGHATLAAAHIIYSLGLRKLGENIIFRAKGGDLSVKKEGGFIAMDFPQYPIKKIKINKGFKKIIGFEPKEMYSSSYNWVIAIAGSDCEILEAAPDFEKAKAQGLGHLIITAKSTVKSMDFCLRCFAPSLGVNEDPVTGSAHCALTPLWNNKTGKTIFNSIQLSKRGGVLKTAIINDGIEIRGKAVTIFKAELLA